MLSETKEIKIEKNNQQKEKQRSSDNNSCNIITNNIATNIFDATSTIKSAINLSLSINNNENVISLATQTAFENFLNALNQFATQLATNGCGRCCIPPKEWICFLQCIIRSIYNININVKDTGISSITNVILVVRPLLERIALVVGLVPTSINSKSEDNSSDCNGVCYAINLVFASILEMIAASLSDLAITLGNPSMSGLSSMTFTSLSQGLNLLINALRCQQMKCCRLLYTCALSQVLTSLNLLFANFIASNETVGNGNVTVANVLRQDSIILSSLTSDCLSKISSPQVKVDKNLKQQICGLQNVIQSAVALSLSPLSSPPPTGN